MSQMCYYDKVNYRINEENFFESFLRKGDCVIDVGANIGMLTLKSASIVGENGLVYAIEAFPQIVNCLKKNIKLNQFLNIQVFNTAVGNKKGKIFLNYNQIDDTMNDVSTTNNGIEVSMSLLDELIPNNKKINLLKVDVEGFELFVFQSATNILGNTDCIFFEAWNENFLKYDYNIQNLLEFLIFQNFLIFRIENGELIKVERTYTPHTCEDLIAVNKLSLDSVLERLKSSYCKRGDY